MYPGKRLFDLVLVVPAMLVLAPVMGMLALVILAAQGRPVLFTQVRPGHKGRPFRLYKYRTMSHMIEKQGSSIPDAERLTTFGKFMRSLSLDELPELFNILRGDMSFVGPRPLLMEYLTLYSPEQMRRHEVLPGLTGWAQVHGRNKLSWKEKFEHDAWYVDHQSFLLDVRILLMTVGKVLKREGITQEGQATAEQFQGNDPRQD
ncbi:MAG: sugar transferase [Chloroflexi bacterium]|nr:sugar transferase [Chloroflexota bacterium]